MFTVDPPMPFHHISIMAGRFVVEVVGNLFGDMVAENKRTRQKGTPARWLKSGEAKETRPKCLGGIRATRKLLSKFLFNVAVRVYHRTCVLTNSAEKGLNPRKNPPFRCASPPLGGLPLKECGLPRVELGQIENGQRKSIKPQTLRKLAEALEKPEMYFYREVMLPPDSLPDSLRGVMTRLLALPRPQQEKLGHIFEQIVDLYKIK